MRYYKYLVFLWSIALYSCVCPPSADTPQELVPSEYANISFLNAVHNATDVSIYTKYGQITKSNIPFRGFSEYLKIGSGNNFIILNNNINKFYKAGVNFEKDKYYTFIAAGNTEQIKTLSFEDRTENFNKSNSYLRIINSYLYLPKLNIKLDSIATQMYYYAEFTDFTKCEPEEHNIRMYVDEELIINLFFRTKNGYVYTVVPYYDPNETNIYGLTCSIIEIKIL